MEHIKLLLKCRIYALLMLFLIPSLALAVLIYEWQDAYDPESTDTGTIIFADDVAFGDIIDPLSDNLLEFSFSNITLSNWSMSDFASGNFLRPEASGVDLDPTGFSIPGSSGGAKKKAASKSRIFSFERDDAYLDFTVGGAVKKKAATKGSDPALDPFPLWSWSSSVPPVECPAGTACKKSATEPSGEGYWVLKSGTVPVPEPATFLLTLTGLGVIISLYRRGRRRV